MKIDEKDLYKWHELDNQFYQHFLYSSYNQVVELTKDLKGKLDPIMSNLMRSVVDMVKQEESKNREISELRKYVDYLHSENKRLLILTKR